MKKKAQNERNFELYVGKKKIPSPKHSWKIFIVRGGKYYYRVHLHDSNEAYEKYFALRGKEKLGKESGACCTCPSMADNGKKFCIGEVNFYYPNIFPSTLAHEFWHAVINYFAFLGERKIVPPFNYIECNYTLPKKIHADWSRKHEHGAGAIEYMMQQMHDKFIRFNIASTAGKKRIRL